MKKIVLIVPYFGELPNYFELWMLSASYNKNIDFVILTDNDIKCKSTNINIIKCCFEDIKEKIRKKFPFEIILNKPYELTKFKPAYGYIFDDIIKDYDFWGYCDVDLIFGNIRKFITEEILLNYDKVLSHGHLSLYKNRQDINELFMNHFKDCIYYKDAFSSTIPWHNFDEYPYGVAKIANKMGIKVYEAPIFADIDMFCFTFKKVFSYMRKSDDNSNIIQYFYWNEGSLINMFPLDRTKNKEIIYVHLQKRVMQIENYENNTSFYILPNYFDFRKKISDDEILEVCDISQNNEYSNKILKLRQNKIEEFKKERCFLNFNLWKRKIFYFKMKYIYKEKPYKFEEGEI